MKKAICALTVAVLCACGSVRAQWTIDLNETTQHLDSICAGSTHPLADGTEIRIYHDWNSNGVDDLDTLLQVCDDPPTCDAGPAGTVNYNVFWINSGSQSPFWAGGFQTILPPLEMSVFSAYAEPSPNRIYLRVCFGSRHYYSEILTPTGGGTYTDIEITTWTCVEAGCAGGPPPTPEQFHASDSTHCDTVRLSWRFSTAPDANVDSVFLYRGVDYIGRVRATQTDTVFLDATAPDAQQYTYYAKSRRNLGGGSYVFSAPAQDFGSRKSRPGQATGLAAADTGCTVIHLSWNTLANTDSFRIYRNGAYLTRVTGATTAYNDNPAPGTYAYRILPVNTCGLGDTSVVDSGTRRISTTQVSGLYATEGQCFETIVGWQAMSGVDSFMVKRNAIRLGRALGTDTAYSDVSGAPGVWYTYTVTVYDPCGPGPESLPDSGWKLASPARPTGVAATQELCDRVVLTWQDVSFESSYIIRRNSGIIAFVVGDTTSFTDYPPIGSYAYTVQAINECGASQTSSPATGTRAGPPSIILQTAEEECPAIVLSWTHSANANWVRVFRDGALLDSVLCPSSQYVDTGMSPGVHSYFVMAVNECGFFLSDTLFAEAVQMPQPPDSVTFTDNHCDHITLTWTYSGGAFSHYRIYRDGSLYDSVPSSVTTFADTNVIGGATYRYRVSAMSDTCGESGLSEEISAALTNSPPPSSPTVVVSIADQDAQLTWNRVTSSDSGCPLTVTGYLVFYAPTAGGPFYYHGFTTDTTYTHVRVVHYNFGMYYQVLSTTEPLTLLQQLPAEATLEETMHLLREGVRSR